VNSKPIAIFTSGASPNLSDGAKMRVKELALQCQTIYAADGGANHLFDLGILPSLVMGDMDSVASETLLWLKKNKVTIRQFPIEKELSDLELCLQEAARLKHVEALIFFALGGRLDHTLLNVFSAFNHSFSDLRLKFFDGDTTIIPLKGSDTLQISLRVGSMLSLIPLSESVAGVTLSGVKWPLDNKTLLLGKSLTLSNEVVSCPVHLSFEEGKLLFIHNT
jgi:thiamine pyrophosphokinase